MRQKQWLLAFILLFLACFQMQAKEVEIVFTPGQQNFVSTGTNTCKMEFHGITIEGTNILTSQTTEQYRWYNREQFMVKSSTYNIRKIVFTKDGVDGNNTTVRCKDIKLTDKSNGKITYNNDNKPYSATWKYSKDVKQVEFINEDQAVWLGKIIVTIDENPTLTIDGSSDTGNNSGAIAAMDGKEYQMVCLNRQFIADGGWYTLCLPFDRSIEQMKEAFGEDVEIMEFASATRQDDGNVQIKFSRCSGDNPIASGVPYLMKPSQNTGEQIVFSDVSIHNVNPGAIDHNGVRFIGTYDPFELPYNDRHYAFLSGKEGLDLAYSNVEGAKIKGTRAYFVFPNEATGVSERVEITDESVANVQLVFEDKAADGADYYTLSGLKIGGKPTRPGLYIHHGRKIVIR